jgi:hypothetical protein
MQEHRLLRVQRGPQRTHPVPHLPQQQVHAQRRLHCRVPRGYVEVKKGTSQFGRTCELSFTCAKGKVATVGHPRFEKNCQCPDVDCHICNLGEDASVCTRCKNSKYLHDGECLDLCPSGLTNNGVSAFGRACAAPFTCDNGRSLSDRTPCACSDTNCLTCEWLAGNAIRTSVCKACKNSFFFHGGRCLRSCPVGTTPVGTDATNRVCK